MVPRSVYMPSNLTRTRVAAITQRVPRGKRRFSRLPGELSIYPVQPPRSTPLSLQQNLLTGLRHLL